MIINAIHLQAGDVWLGDPGTDIELHVTTVHVGAENQMFIPWNMGRSTPPVPMQAVHVAGILHRPGPPPYAGTWVLQPDQPVEVRRDD